jgi:hypothetical protein
MDDIELSPIRLSLLSANTPLWLVLGGVYYTTGGVLALIKPKADVPAVVVGVVIGIEGAGWVVVGEVKVNPAKGSSLIVEDWFKPPIILDGV